jgi:hypothetical protein
VCGASAGLMPCPFSVIYGATKAFLTEFATSLACEVKRTPFFFLSFVLFLFFFVLFIYFLLD